MTAGARCPECGHPAAPRCARGHAAARSLLHRAAMMPGRGFPPFDFASGLRAVPSAALALIHGRPFVGRLHRPIWINAVVFLLLVAGAVALVPAVADDGRDQRDTALWVLTVWMVAAPPLWALLTGRAQRRLLAIAEHTMLGLPLAAAPLPGAEPTLRDRLLVIVLAAVVLPFALAALQIPYAGIPLVAVVGAAMAAVSWFAAPLAACGLPPAERYRVLWRNRWRALGTGLGLQLLTTVPFVNLLLLPSVAAVAATAAFLRFDKC